MSADREKEGTLEFAVESEQVNLTTNWSKLHVPKNSALALARVTCGQLTPAAGSETPNSQVTQRDKGYMYSCTVGIKALLKFLTSHLVGQVAIASECDLYIHSGFRG